MRPIKPAPQPDHRRLLADYIKSAMRVAYENGRQAATLNHLGRYEEEDAVIRQTNLKVDECIQDMAGVGAQLDSLIIIDQVGGIPDDVLGALGME